MVRHQSYVNNEVSIERLEHLHTHFNRIVRKIQ